MRRLRLVSALLPVILLSACSGGEAFVDRGYTRTTVAKQKLPGHDGVVEVCFGGDTPRAERDKLAEDACAVYGLEARLVLERRWQCRLTVPHHARYACIDPNMRLANGGLVDPFDASMVAQWKQEQKLTAPAP